MNLLEALGNVIGIVFILVFVSLMVLFFATGRGRTVRNLREIPAFSRLRRNVGLSVESGTRVHVSLGRGGILGAPAGSAIAWGARIGSLRRCAGGYV